MLHTVHYYNEEVETFYIQSVSSLTLPGDPCLDTVNDLKY